MTGAQTRKSPTKDHLSKDRSLQILSKKNVFSLLHKVNKCVDCEKAFGEANLTAIVLDC